ncbi:MAG: protease inhibitor I42 family protein [Gemmataceae bacterium]
MITTDQRAERVCTPSAGTCFAGRIPYKAYPAGDGVPGSGGQTTFTFKAAEAGSCEMELVYRSFPGRDPKPARRFTVSVEVKE